MVANCEQSSPGWIPNCSPCPLIHGLLILREDKYKQVQKDGKFRIPSGTINGF